MMGSFFRSPVVMRIIASIALAATALCAGSVGLLGPQSLRAQAVASAPFVHGLGPQGLGYYAVPGVAAAAAGPRLTVPTQARASTSSGGRSVGPGARNWATGNRVPSHRPWLRSRS